jgi:alanine racemase
MTELQKLPFILNNLKIIDRDYIKKKSKIAIVIKKRYKIFSNTNMGYFASLIDSNTDLVDVYCFESLSDAIAARKFGLTKKIIVLYYISPEEVESAINNDIEITCPNIDWLKKAIQLLKSNKKLKLHIYFDASLGRYGFLDENKIYELLTYIKDIKVQQQNIQIAGIGTMFNLISNNKSPNFAQLRITYKLPLDICQKIYKDLIKEDMNKFNIIIKTVRDRKLIDSTTIIHAATTGAVLNEVDELYYDLVRLGHIIFTPMLTDFTAKTQILSIKILPKGSCINYGCDNQKKAHTDLTVAYIKELDIEGAIYKYNGQILNSIGVTDPFGLIINGLNKSNITVGDYIDVYSAVI